MEGPHETERRIGDVGQVALPVAGLVAVLVHHDQKGAAQLALSLGAALAATHTLKSTVNTRRPDGGSRSFPSGHTASAFAGAAFLQRRYGWNYGAPAYAAAVFVGYSRVVSDKHWIRDVVAGAALGVVSNLAFTRRHAKVGLVPVAPGGQPGLTVTVSW